MKTLAGRTVLFHVLTRCKQIPGADGVCCAIPEGEIHDPIALEATRAGAQVFRGSEQDVLDRYHAAARMLGSDIIMRVTSDCPLIDPDLCGRVLQLVRNGADYACNNMPSSWPHGLDCEAFTMAALEKAARLATESYDREHVTPWLRREESLDRRNLPGPGGWTAEQRWTLDFPEDYKFFEALVAALPAATGSAGSSDILAFLKQHPDIAAINRHLHVSRPPAPEPRRI